MSVKKSRNSFLYKAARLRALGPNMPEFKFGLHLARPGPNEKFIKLPFKRSWIVILLSGVFFAVFCIPYITTGPIFSEMGSDNLFDLVFGLFWLMGWSVGVVVLGPPVVMLLAVERGKPVFSRSPLRH